MQFADGDAAMAWCTQEQANLVAAVRQAADAGEHAIAWQLAEAMWGFFYQRKPWQDWIETHRIGLRSAELSGDDLGVATMLGNLAVAYREQRRQHEAEECFQRALDTWSLIGDDYGQALVCNGYGNACREWGRLDEAVSLSHRALRTWQTLGERHELQLALRHSEEALTAFRAVGDRYAEVWATNNAANVHRDLGHLHQSVDMHREALAARRQLGDRYGQALTLQSLAEGLDRLGDNEGREEALRAALEIFSELGDPKADEVRAALG